MPSQSLLKWNIERLPSLANIENAHAAIVGPGRGRRYITQQINQAFAMMVSSHFQGFCRDLHSECVDIIATTVTPQPIQNVLRVEFLYGRKLETGNPNPGNIGNDFNRFGFKLFDAMKALAPKTTRQKAQLESLNVWRNAIAHQDFTKSDLCGKTTISIARVRAWRSACGELAQTMDLAMQVQLKEILGIQPW